MKAGKPVSRTALASAIRAVYGKQLRLKETEERAFPAPQLGLEAAVKFTERWYGEARYQYVHVNASNASGSLGQLDAAVAFQFDRNIAAGMRY